jgi:hypothetical protein
MITKDRPGLASARGAALRRCGRPGEKPLDFTPLESDTCDRTLNLRNSTNA